MSHSVIYVLFKSSKRATPGIKIITEKDHFILSQHSRTGNIYTHTDIHKRTHTETKHYDAIFGASKKEFPISTMETAVKCLD